MYKWLDIEEADVIVARLKHGLVVVVVDGDFGKVSVEFVAVLGCN